MRQVYPGKKRYKTEAEQDAYVHKWLDDAGLGEEGAKVNLVFYKGRYHSASFSAHTAYFPLDLIH